MKIEIPSHEVIKELVAKKWTNCGERAVLLKDLDTEVVAFVTAIEYANEHLAKAPKELNISRLAHMMEAGFEMELTWEEIATTIAEQYHAEVVASPEPWKPLPGMKCAFWDTDNGTVQIGVFERLSLAAECKYGSEAIGQWVHSSELLSLDEIGKPPSYFIERDERHI